MMIAFEIIFILFLGILQFSLSHVDTHKVYKILPKDREDCLIENPILSGEQPENKKELKKYINQKLNTGKSKSIKWRRKS